MNTTTRQVLMIAAILCVSAMPAPSYLAPFASSQAFARMVAVTAYGQITISMVTRPNSKSTDRKLGAGILKAVYSSDNNGEQSEQTKKRTFSGSTDLPLVLKSDDVI